MLIPLPILTPPNVLVVAVVNTNCETASTQVPWYSTYKLPSILFHHSVPVDSDTGAVSDTITVPTDPT